ncbi:protein kinase domain-containing protein [Actinospica sp.]|uniref:protein kinase domain-containing protein n=1 Tax=Actinospica sp. TaxID=1872142 RepID=UPI002CA4AA9D|nr:protein kinase [Actinospica sp.]HWG27167.1 protein kinase [Actinospica sp.]
MGGNRYALHEVIGHGGMGEVWAATDLMLRRTVAVKVMHAHLVPDAAARTRFLREARAAASLNHPCIAAVYDTGVLPYPVERPYIAMELVQGRTIAEQLLLAPPSVEQSLSWTAGLLEALDYAHAAGLVHRDIKPANVMVTPSGEVKVMDFGIAFATGGGETGLTAAGIVLGTVAYMSPEQAQGRAVDARSDLYSAGCVLYELLTGRPPHLAETPIAIAYRHVHTSTVPPSLLNPAVPPGLESAVLRSLAKSPDDRFPAAEAMRQALLTSFPPAQRGQPRQADTEPADTDPRAADPVDADFADTHARTRFAPDAAIPATPATDPRRAKTGDRSTRIALAVIGFIAACGFVTAAALYTTGPAPSAPTQTHSSAGSSESGSSSGPAAGDHANTAAAAAAADKSATSSIQASSAVVGKSSAQTAASPAASGTGSSPTTSTSSTTTPVEASPPISSAPSSPLPSPPVSKPIPSPK